MAKKDTTLSKKICKYCEIYQKLKSKASTNFNIPKNVTAKKRLELIAIDFLSDLIRIEHNNKHIFVIIDIFTKFINHNL